MTLVRKQHGRRLRSDALRLMFCLVCLLHSTLNEPRASLALPANWPGAWSLLGRTKIQTTPDSIIIAGGYAVEKQAWDNAEISFRARAPLGTEQVQIWGGFRFRDRDSRYVFALRGGNDNDLYLARYAPNGNAEFLGFAPLHFKPVPGDWYRLRMVVLGSQFHLYLNDEKLPRLNVTDHEAQWNQGGVLIGGGWLPAEFADFQVRPLAAEDLAKFRAIGNRHWAEPQVDKEALRKNQRAAYVPVTVTNLNPLRTEVSLDGNWLFLPDYQLPAGPPPVQLAYDDQNWHVMPVPSFWTPGLSWLHGETGFPNLDALSKTKGVADSLYVQENARCDSYTFDWRKTRSAWYRHYVDLPPSLGSRRFELSFEAIAKVSEIWVNGIEVGAHTGMFGEVSCDVTKAIKPGRNLIAVHVANERVRAAKTSDEIEGVAVTVEVTSAMLNSLPHGMLQDGTGGIWQPVKLTATAPVLVSGCFVEPGLHQADIQLDILNTTREPSPVQIDYSITSAQDGSLLYSNQVPQLFSAMPGETGHLKLSTPDLNPKLWTPQEPNLYRLDVRLNEPGREIDHYHLRFGFRTFTADGNKFLLNGRPFWLRGANPFPNTLRPNDTDLARRFIQTARDGNVRVTRSHIVPFTSAWLDAADEVGMAVSFEGTWPWLMLRGEPPDEDLLKIWKDEYLSLIREHRNHPSIILWTVNNEMKFEDLDQHNPPLLKKKWLVLDDAIKSIRQADPTRPVIADSSYVRKQAQRGYATLVQPKGLDDGDADDVHAYFGWYENSFFHFFNGEYNQKYSTPGRPLISQEMSTGYPNNDDGHPVRFYLFKNHTPQALVGDDAYENADPAIFLKRQAFMTKELAETVRRNSHERGAGLLLFSYFTWFQTPWSPAQIKPQAAYYALKTALQPVLVSAELYGRHYYAGRTISSRVCLVNDAEDYQPITNASLIWEFKSGDNILNQGRAEVPAVGYYSNRWLAVDFVAPQNLPAPKVDGQLFLRLEACGKVLSTNNYEVTLATSAWANGGSADPSEVALWNPGKHTVGMLSNLNVSAVSSIAEAPLGKILVVGNLKGITLTSDQTNDLRKFVSEGGRVLMLHPGASLIQLFPDKVTRFAPKKAEIVTMRIPESPVFDEIEPLDLAWFNQGDRQLPLACTGVYQMAGADDSTIGLIDQCDLHGYLNKPTEVAKISGTPLLEIRLGKGRLLASELCFESAGNDPIARRLLMNSLHYLQP